MPRLVISAVGPAFRIAFAAACCAVLSSAAGAQEPPPPAYLAVVEGVAILERNGESEPAVRDMPFLEGDRLRTENGRVEIQFPDGTAIEVAEFSLVEAVTPTRVRLLAGTMDHIQRPAPPEAPQPLSASYLPQDLQGYGNTFDRDGSWQYAAPYGYVWYPAVAPGWRPYYYGRWYAAPSYGWIWLGIDAWSYPTHHYGRWGYARNAWFWIPGRSWGPAWVSWGVAPDYVSWCPLGFDNRPVFALSVASYDSWRHGGGNWFGWTVMSRSRFGGRGSYAHRYAVEPRSLPADTPFIVSSRPPANLPHQGSRQSPSASRQSAVGGRQSPSASRQSAVGGRQLPSASRQSAVGGRQSPVGSRQSPVEDQQFAVPRRSTADPASASAVLPGADSRIANPRGDYGAARRFRPSDDQQESPATSSRQPAAGFGVPPFDRAQGRRRAYPVDAPRVEMPRVETPRAAVPERPRMYPMAVPRSAPAPAAPIIAPQYRAPGQRIPDSQPAFDGAQGRPFDGAQGRQRWNPTLGAAPRSYGAPAPGAPSLSPAPRSFGAPVQRGPAAAPAPAPAAPSRSEGARPAPSGGAREGTAQPRGQGAPAGARRPR
jgi:hypothetical protein